ncbi:hypothetical protein [Martelella alba]|uniref:Uncharacterized protein n=1 Tax=Martelella alba TaxID=2590451 RepID=A0ABY2SIM0_9HYPH|nr:hypothetical protein [Martelella alba]TKI04653.1 hypothetical protein FCN80_16960 [Martelella alba]
MAYCLARFDLLYMAKTDLVMILPIVITNQLPQKMGAKSGKNKRQNNENGQTTKVLHISQRFRIAIRTFPNFDISRPDDFHSFPQGKRKLATNTTI